MAKITANCVIAAIIVCVYVRAVAVSGRGVPLHPYMGLGGEEKPFSKIYDTSNYGFLQIGNGLAKTPQMG